MPEEKQVEKSGAAGTDPIQPETPLSEPQAAEESGGVAQAAVNPTVYLLFIMAMVFFLAVIGLRQCNGSGAMPDDAAVAALKADL